MYKDIISYRLAPGISTEHLLQVAHLVAQDRMSKQEGFVSRELHQEKDGSFTDIVTRESKDDAKKSETSMQNMPHGSERHACYEIGSISSKSLIQIGKF